MLPESHLYEPLTSRIFSAALRLVECSVTPSVSDFIENMPENMGIAVACEHQSHADALGVLLAVARLRNLNNQIHGAVYPATAANLTRAQGRYTPLLLSLYSRAAATTGVEMVFLNRVKDVKTVQRVGKLSNNAGYTAIREGLAKKKLLVWHPEGTTENGRKWITKSQELMRVDAQLQKQFVHPSHFIGEFSTGITKQLIQWYPPEKELAFLVAAVEGTPSIFDPVTRRPTHRGIAQLAINSCRPSHARALGKICVGDVVHLSEILPGDISDIREATQTVNVELRRRMIALKN